MKLKTEFKKTFLRLTKEYGTDEVPIETLHKELQAKGFVITEQELEDFVSNNPDCLL